MTHDGAQSAPAFGLQRVLQSPAPQRLRKCNAGVRFQSVPGRHAADMLYACRGAH